jgi:molybdate transport system substrate-binding protein
MRADHAAPRGGAAGRLARACAVLLGLCAQLVAAPACAEEAPRLRVFAAASLTEVVEALAGSFAGARVEPVFGASSALARQIRDGAPADVFVSASPDWIEFLREAGVLAGEPIVLARNRLVCIATPGGALAARGARDARALLEALGPDGRVAIADEGVPAGEYARGALRHLALLDAFLPHLVGQQDVRAVLHAVEQGELPAGFAYATDAKQAGVPVLFAFDPATHAPIEYRAALLRGAPPQARRFLAHLQGEAARALLADAGFARP